MDRKQTNERKRSKKKQFSWPNTINYRLCTHSGGSIYIFQAHKLRCASLCALSSDQLASRLATVFESIVFHSIGLSLALNATGRTNWLGECVCCVCSLASGTHHRPMDGWGHIPVTIITIIDQKERIEFNHFVRSAVSVAEKCRCDRKSADTSEWLCEISSDTMDKKKKVEKKNDLILIDYYRKR